ncbi:hypothetical protein LB579_31430 [Mesorhizobium sp. BR1-1-7]|uniref:hypothetical protein n=1 Tax=Mesorhizobium sp. BR1-1-7 TaxID=2876647 RepID=UPI001CCBAE9D|nr:hypothetical protein [Mesorhizobium sp. BR1-1-7]MBZ9922195.1 hypothetical protein [Mesorhizobium sp. BR1-1-7]
MTMGSKESKTTQENNPPDWAKPLLEKGASEGMKLYDEKKGYNVYGGPTQAQFSPTTLQGMNSLMAATGGGGPGSAPITNEGVFNNPAIQQARQQLAAQAQQKAQQPAPQQPAGQGVWMRQQGGERHVGGREGELQPTYYYVNTLTGETSQKPPAGANVAGSKQRLW